MPQQKDFLHNILQTISLIAISFFVTSQLSGCAATGQNFSGFQSPPTESAQIVVYRPDLFRAGGQSVRIVIDEKEVGVLRNAGWLSIPVKPGERAVALEERFTLFSRGAALMVKPQKGESVVLRILPGGVAGVFPLASGPVVTFGPWTIQQVPQEVAQAELKDLRESK